MAPLAGVVVWNLKSFDRRVEVGALTSQPKVVAVLGNPVSAPDVPERVRRLSKSIGAHALAVEERPCTVAPNKK